MNVCMQQRKGIAWRCDLLKDKHEQRTLVSKWHNATSHASKTKLNFNRFKVISLPHKSSGFFFLDIKIYRSAVCLAFKIFRFSSNSICWHRGIKIPQSTMLRRIYILGNDNVEDDESHSSSPKCQEKIDLLFFFFNFMSTSLKKRDMHYILKCKTFWNSN